MGGTTALDRLSPFKAATHQCPAMWTHLIALQGQCMDPASATYIIRINGHLSATLLSAFPTTAWERRGPETVLTCVLDQPGLFGVLAEIEALGLELHEVRQLEPQPDSPHSGDSRSP